MLPCPLYDQRLTLIEKGFIPKYYSAKTVVCSTAVPPVSIYFFPKVVAKPAAVKLKLHESARALPK